MIKKHKKLMAYLLALAVFSTYVVMDTFVITRVYSTAEGSGVEAGMQISDTESGSSDGLTSDNAAGADTDASEKAGSDDPNTSEKTGKGPGSKNGSGEGHRQKPSGKPGNKADGGSGHHKGPGMGKRSGSESSSSKDKASGSSTDSSSGSSTQKSSSSTNSSSSSSVSSKTTQDSYSDDNMSIKISEYTVSDTTVHVAEVSLDSAQNLKTAFAQGSYGKNVTATTSATADSVDAILAINGDYYGTQEKGYVIRNGELYRNTAVEGREDLVIYKDGTFGIINESEVTAEQLINDGAMQVLSFGPALVENGSISVDSDDEVGRAMASNPRTAIGVKADGTYLFVVSDGRTDESEGLSLLEMAEFMQKLGAKTAYNLDGGGSSTMVFNGNVINTPTGGGIGNGSGSERKVSDIVYIGY